MKISVGVLILLSVLLIDVDAEEAMGGRKKRNVANFIRQLTITDNIKNTIVNRHNSVRREVSSGDMRLMTWDVALQEFATNHVANCNFDHSRNRQIPGFTSTGENLYISFFPKDAFLESGVTSASDSWASERSFYNYQNLSCQTNRACGHYTQMVWARTYKVGCGAAFCVSNNSTDSLLVSCNYGPAGNFINNTLGRVGRPYQQSSTPCSSCQTTGDTCVEGLCANAARGDVIPSSTPTPSQSPPSTPTPSQSSSSTPTPSQSPSSTPTLSQSPSSTPTPSQSPSSTPTPSQSPPSTPTPSQSPSSTPTLSQSPFSTLTPSQSPSSTLTPSQSPTSTPTPSQSPSSTFRPPTATGRPPFSTTPGPTTDGPPTACPTSPHLRDWERAFNEWKDTYYKWKTSYDCSSDL